jgi:hypothetical protein
MSNNPKMISDPGLQRKLSEPVESKEAAIKLGQEFYEELCKLREKYHVAEVVVALGINALNEKGEEVFVIQTGYRGGAKTDRLILELTQQTRFGAAILAAIDEMTVASLS